MGLKPIELANLTVPATSKPDDVDPHQRRSVERALANMPGKQRDIFLAHVRDDLSYAEIASLTGLSSRQVERQMAKAIYKLHRHLEGERLHWWERWF